VLIGMADTVGRMSSGVRATTSPTRPRTR